MTTDASLKNGVDRREPRLWVFDRSAPHTVSPLGDLHQYVTKSALVVGAIAIGIALWAATADLSGAVLAPGTIVVDSNVKKVQHPTGGIVSEIHVKDGARVQAGDLLVKLDDTQARTNLQVITKQLDAIQVRLSRLRAERDGTETMTLSGSAAQRQGEPQIVEMFTGERRLFDSRRAGRARQKAQLGERIVQFREESGGLGIQKASKEEESRLLSVEVKGLETLLAKRLVGISKYTASKREATRLKGEAAQLVTQAAQVRGKIAEVELQILQIDQDALTEIMKDMRESQVKEDELIERQIAADDQLRRTNLNAPISGVVHQLSAHTIGGVIANGEQVMLIVPQGDMLTIESRIAPQDIDHVRVGKSAFVKLSAFNQRTTPELIGTVSHIAADITKDTGTPQAGQPYYPARITLAAAEMKKLGNLQLQPGMPAEVHIKTTERNAWSYFLKPLQDQVARAFKDP